MLFFFRCGLSVVQDSIQVFTSAKSDGLAKLIGVCRSNIGQVDFPQLSLGLIILKRSPLIYILSYLHIHT